MKKNCQKCHFLSHARALLGVSGHRWTSWRQDEREHRMPLPRPSEKEVPLEGCYKGIWKEMVDQFGDGLPGGVNSADRVLLQERGDSCFFVEYREGMSFEAAEDLFRLGYDNRQLKKSYFYTQLGLAVAAVGIVVSVVLKIIEMLSKAPAP